MCDFHSFINIFFHVQTENFENNIHRLVQYQVALTLIPLLNYCLSWDSKLKLFGDKWIGSNLLYIFDVFYVIFSTWNIFRNTLTPNKHINVIYSRRANNIYYSYSKARLTTKKEEARFAILLHIQLVLPVEDYLVLKH